MRVGVGVKGFATSILVKGVLHTGSVLLNQEHQYS